LHIVIINATLINLYHICQRELWLHANAIRMEHTSDIVYEGKLIGDTTYADRAEKNKQVELNVPLPGGWMGSKPHTKYTL
jgi:CRISPR-associated exonuclease Cas4